MKTLRNILTEGVVGCGQPKGWMDNRTMSIWYELIYRPYVSQFDGEAALLLDAFVCHKGSALKEAMKDDNAHRIMIPPYYTCIVQPCVVAINKPLKDRLKASAAKWRRERYVQLAPGSKMPPPKREDVLA